MISSGTTSARAEDPILKTEGVPPLLRPTLTEVMRRRMRLQHYSLRTEEAYVGWVKRFIRFHQGRHPREMGVVQIRSFLESLAVERHVSASTQNQALQALLYLYERVLEKEVGDLGE